MKPTINEGNYLINIFDTNGDEVKQVRIKQGLNYSVDSAEEFLRNYPIGYFYRIMRCLKNSKYNIHSPGAKV